MDKAACAGDYRTFFEISKKHTNRSGIVTDTICDVNGKIITELDQRLERWRTHFEDLLNSEPPPNPITSNELGWEGAYNADDDNSPPTLDEITRAVKSLKSNRSAGADGLPPEVFKNGGLPLYKALQRLFACIWRTNSIPEEWRVAILLPFFKKGDKKMCQNYRGISLLNIAFKILESVVLQRYRLAHDKVMRENQAGFRAGRGCVDQIFALKQILEHRHEYRQSTVVCFVDFKAAFDSVDRQSVFNIMEADGLPTKLLKIIRCMYSVTKSRVRAYGTTTDDFIVNTGVRQGSIQSPVMFNYAVDWVLKTSKCEKHGVLVGADGFRVSDLDYADDIALLAETESDMQQMIDSLKLQCDRIGLKINTGKTKVMSCCTNAAPAISVDGSVLINVDSFCYLGSIVTGSGSSQGDISNRIAAAASAFGAFKRLWRQANVSTQTKLKIYDACVRTVLLYGAETWSTKSRNHQSISIFDRACLRSIIGVSRLDHMTNEELYHRTGRSDNIPLLIQHKRLRWLGHVLRMDNERLPKKTLLSSPPTSWRRPKGRAILTWKRMILKELEPAFRFIPWRAWRSRPFEALEMYAQDRSK